MDRDVVVQALIETVPYVGGSLSTLYFGHKQEKRFRRLETFYHELQREVNGIRDRIASISNHDPQELSAILEELHERVESENLETKRRLYKNYFKNTLVQPVRGNFDERKYLLDVLAYVTPLQLEIIAYLSGQTGYVRALHKPGVEASLMTGSVTQLEGLGLIESKVLSMSVMDAGILYDRQIRLSPLGRRFHQFCMCAP